jgi:hypothetical protein
MLVADQDLSKTLIASFSSNRREYNPSMKKNTRSKDEGSYKQDTHYTPSSFLFW